jgi:hypothetical protein
MANGNDRAAARRERRQKEIQERRAGHKDIGEKQVRQRMLVRYGLIAAGLLISIGVVYFVYTIYADWESRRPPDGVQEFTGMTNFHTNDTVAYEQNPPVGGDHSPIWQNCDFYSVPIRNEHAVHSLEHGAVWITFQPELPQDQVNMLREMTNRSYVLVSPFPEDLPAPIVASAWGLQMQFDSADDPELSRFVSAYRQGPQTLEPGAICHGGTSAAR